MDSALLLAACERVTRVVNQVCGDSKKLYGKSYETINTAISQLEECIQLLKQRAGISDHHVEAAINSTSASDRYLEEHILKVLSGMNSTTSKPEPAINTDSKHSQFSTNTRNKQETYEYCKIFKKLPDNLSNYPEIKRLATILDAWFTTVLAKASGPNPVKFKRSRIHEWVEDIVIGYGKFRNQHDIDSFISIMNRWMNDDNNTYIVPGEIYRFSRNLKDADMTLDALVIWDILYDNGLHQFSTISDRSGFSPLALRSRFEMCSSDFYALFSKYKKYKSDPTVLKELKISCQEVIL